MAEKILSFLLLGIVLALLMFIIYHPDLFR